MHSFSPSFSRDSPDLTQVVTGVISVEHQDTLPEIAQQKVDPRPSGTSPPGLHLTSQTSPPPAAASQAAGGNSPGSPCTPQLPGIVYERAVGSCPLTTLKLGGVHVHCFLDSGSQVSTITESFFNKHFRPRRSKLLDTNQWLTLTAANGLEIPYIGYLELDFEAQGVTILQRGILVVRDPPDPQSRARKEDDNQAVAFTQVSASEVVIQPKPEESPKKEDSPKSTPIPPEDMHCTPEQQAKLDELLAKYKDMFVTDDDELGYTETVKHKIFTTDDIPVNQPFRRIPPGQYQEAKEHIQKLLSQGIIRESHSPYSSPIVLVRKKNGSLRMCVDYRKLNAKTVKDAYPLPRIEESFDALQGASWFSTLDLASGFNQIGVTEEDKAKTAFITPFGLFEYNRMPFGLCNAPACFARLMQACLNEQIFQILLVYLDDILIFSKTFEEHLERLEMVLKRLREHGLKLKLEKCTFLRRRVTYLGHEVSGAGIAPDPQKIAVVQEWPVPQTVKELRTFLGFASYYRRFIESFAKIAGPLHQLVNNSLHELKVNRKLLCPFKEKWSQECQEAFDIPREKLTTAPVLGYADYTKPFIVETDASHDGLGAVLSQE